jgi:hypothetical protein
MFSISVFKFTVPQDYMKVVFHYHSMVHRVFHKKTMVTQMFMKFHTSKSLELDPVLSQIISSGSILTLSFHLSLSLPNGILSEILPSILYFLFLPYTVHIIYIWHI